MKELISALAKARLEFKQPEQDRTATVTPRDSNKAGYSYNYASLPEIVGCTYEALSNHGLLIATTTEIREDGRTYAIVTLWHESGDSMSSDYALRNANDPKDFGGELKSIRRHLICGLLNISPSEEAATGAGSQGANGKGQKPVSPKQKPQQQRSQEGQSDDSGDNVAPINKPATVQRINKAKKSYRLPTEVVMRLLTENGLPADVYKLDEEQSEQLIRLMFAEAIRLQAIASGLTDDDIANLLQANELPPNAYELTTEQISTLGRLIDAEIALRNEQPQEA